MVTSASKRHYILLGFILLKLLLQFLMINSDYDLQRDEFLHLDQANHLAPGYSSVPPVSSWIAYLIKALGNSVYWVRFFPALFGALTLMIVWKTIEVLKGNLYALILGATCILLSVLVRINLLFQPNSLDVLSWTAFFYTIILYVNTEKPKWLYLAAGVFALGFLNKYNIVFLIIGLLPALLLSGQRKILMRKEFYLSLLLTLLLISPNLYWQFINHFPVLHHLKELNERQLVHVSRWLFLKEQLLYFIAALPLIVASLYALLCYQPFKKFKFLFWSFVFTLLTFVYLRAKGYYAIGLYPIYIAIGSAYLGGTLSEGWRIYLRPVLLVIPILFYLLLFRVAFAMESTAKILSSKQIYQNLGLLRWEDGKEHILPQDYSDMLGWKELAEKVDIVYESMPQRKHTIILCDNYGQAGAINYYSRHQLQAVSFNADYINWFDLEQKADNVIRVKEYPGSEKELAESSRFFHRSYIAGAIANPLAREFKTTIFALIGAKTDVNKRLRAEIAEEKNY
jgi:hypothetical protein